MKEELIGLSVLEEHKIRCGSCGTNLVEVVVTETNEARVARGLNPQRMKFVVGKCYKCGGSSLPTQIFEGSCIAGPLKKDYESDTVDVDVDDDTGVITNTLTTRWAVKQ